MVFEDVSLWRCETWSKVHLERLTRRDLRKTFAAAEKLEASPQLRARSSHHAELLANPSMMMAHDSTPGPGALAAETIDAVRSALVRYVVEPSDGEPLRQALDSMAAEAHQKSILPEQLLVVLKDVWYELPTVRAMRDQAEHTRLLQRVVTICIKEYYGD